MATPQHRSLAGKGGEAAPPEPLKQERGLECRLFVLVPHLTLVKSKAQLSLVRDAEMDEKYP